LFVALVVQGCTGDRVVAPDAAAPDERVEVAAVVAQLATHRCDRRSRADVQAEIEVFEFDIYALYVPACVRDVRALVLTLGGPDTRAFVTGKTFGAPLPDAEASLQLLGEALRTLAATNGLAILGSSRRSIPNTPDSDGLLFDAIRAGAQLSSHPELATAPLFLYGLSGGAPLASGLTARNPQRVAGLFLKVPAGVTSLTDGSALGVPTYLVLAELDLIVNNAATTAAFEANRRAGALWALAMERGVGHHSLSQIQREVTVQWMRTILRRRLPAAPSRPLREITERSGWLGDRATGETWRWAAYRGDRSLASWLPSRAVARQWEDLVGIHP
jgi:hypothetical protein